MPHPISIRTTTDGYSGTSAVVAPKETLRYLQKSENYFVGGGFRLFRAAPGRRRAFRFRALWEAFCARLSSMRRNARPNDSRRASKPISAAGGCTMITMSRATNHSLWVRNKCRRRRLIRFRVWALPTLRETVSPTRPRPLGARFPITTRAEVVPRLPTRWIYRKSLRRRRRRERLKDSDAKAPESLEDLDSVNTCRVDYFLYTLATRRLRPWARRRLTTSRPPGDAMRARNP